MPDIQNNSTEVTTTNSNNVDGEIQKNGNDTIPEIKSLDEAMALIQKLSADKKAILDEKYQVKRKLSKFEEEAQQREATALAEQGKYKELYEQANQKITALETARKDGLVSSAIKDVLKEAGARSVETVMKLVDKTSVEFDEAGNVKVDSVKSIVDGIKKSDPILFGTPVETPPVKRVTEGPVEGSFEKEVAAAKTPEQLKAIMAKYAGKF